jgi:hypothetical protein
MLTEPLPGKAIDPVIAAELLGTLTAATRPNPRQSRAGHRQGRPVVWARPTVAYMMSPEWHSAAQKTL